jgi:phage terminase small subunit
LKKSQAQGRRTGRALFLSNVSKSVNVKAMPRKSAAELSVVTGTGSRVDRLRPPASLSEAERTAFIEIVNSCDPKHFVRSDLPLLCRYAEASVLAEQAARELRQGGAVISGRPSPWIAVQEKAVRAMVALSMRLRLSPQARQPNNPSRKAAGAVSAYDLMEPDDDGR